MSGAIFLIGARAAGKTTIGGLLATRLRLPFFDTDAMLVERSGLTVAEIVASEGWPGFRQRESEILRELVDRPPVGEYATGDRPTGLFSRVIATGGGMILEPANRALLRAGGLVLFLEAPADVLAARLAAAPEAAQRPSLSGPSGCPSLEMREILRQRTPFYRETARLTINATRPIPEVLEQILRNLEKIDRS